jgi:hypothetical protein
MYALDPVRVVAQAHGTVECPLWMRTELGESSVVSLREVACGWRFRPAMLVMGPTVEFP